MYGGGSSASAAKYGQPFDYMKYSKANYNQTSRGLYTQYNQKPLSTSLDAAARRNLGGVQSSMGQCPFSREQLEEYRKQVASKATYAPEETKFTQDHYRIYKDILGKLPSSKHDMG